MMRNLQIPVAKYEKIASEFNPVKFDANEWIKIAKDAGMKYMVFTSKHHDGFAMYNSPSSDYNIVDQLDSISCYLGVNAFYRQPELTDWFTARELIHYTWNDTGKHIQDSIHV